MFLLGAFLILIMQTTPELLHRYGFRVIPENQPESGTIYSRGGFEVSQVENTNEFVYEGGREGRVDVSTIEQLKRTWYSVKGTEL